MIPIQQRIVDQHRGDCMTACIASVLERSYESVPTWVADAYDAGDATDAQAAMTAWLRERNMHLLSVSWDHLNDWRALCGAFCIATMPSQRFPGGSHAVIATWERVSLEGGSFYHQLVIVHDPSPLNKPYDLKEKDPIALSFLVPVNPAAAIFLPNWGRGIVTSPTGATFHCSTCNHTFRASEARIVDGMREFPCCKVLKDLV